jgi:hypothetical protein
MSSWCSPSLPPVLTTPHSRGLDSLFVCRPFLLSASSFTLSRSLVATRTQPIFLFLPSDCLDPPQGGDIGQFGPIRFLMQCKCGSSHPHGLGARRPEHGPDLHFPNLTNLTETLRVGLSNRPHSFLMRRASVTVRLSSVFSLHRLPDKFPNNNPPSTRSHSTLPFSIQLSSFSGTRVVSTQFPFLRSIVFSEF